MGVWCPLKDHTYGIFAAGGAYVPTQEKKKKNLRKLGKSGYRK